MAVSYKRVRDSIDVWGRTRVEFKDFIAPSGTTYPSGGFVINAATFGLKIFRGIAIVGGDVSQGTYFGVFDFGTSFPSAGAQVLPATVKLRLFTASGTELSGTVGSTGYNIRIAGYGV